MTHKELLTAIDDFRYALSDARDNLERLEGSPRRLQATRRALDHLGARGANLIDVAMGAVKVEG